MKILAALILTFSVGFSQTSRADNSDSVNFRINPIGIIIGAIGVDFDFKIHDHWTLGPSLMYWRHRSRPSGGQISDIKASAYSIGARANWFMNGIFTDGLYVGPSINLIGAKGEATDVDGTTRSSTANFLTVQGLVGYAWFWKSFNQMLGGGMGVGIGKTRLEIEDSTGKKWESGSLGAGLALEYSLGWTF
jgi:hypothetical protein